MTAESAERTEFRTCPLCEATCGLAITMAGDRVVKIRGDEDDAFSKGFICPKGASLGALQDDPDRLTQPMVKEADGTHRPATWDEAFERVAESVAPYLGGSRDVFATYLGNPNAHNLSALLYNTVLIKAIGTKTRFSASSLDQLPKQLASGRMYGSSLSIAIPDIDRTDLMLILGANPLASNGSMMTAPDFRGRIRAIRARGGRVVVVDPMRTRTAKEGDLHLPIRPGTDVFLLFAILNVLVNEGFVARGLAKMGDKAGILTGVESVCAEAEHFAPETVAPKCGVTADEIRTLARDLGNADHACVYGRIGTCTQEFGTAASWLVDVINIVTGNLDREGGVMFPNPAAGGISSGPGSGRGVAHARWGTRLRDLPETFGELPTAALAEEIDTPGEGQVKVLFTSGGNPILSAPNGDRLQAAFEQLDFYFCIDPYLNESTRYADVIFPPPAPLAKAHYDIAFYQLSIRDTANYSPAIVDKPEGMLEEWETMLKLSMIFAGQAHTADISGLDDFVALEVAKRELAREDTAAAGMTPEDVCAGVSHRRGPERLLDILLRCGPHGDGFGRNPDGLSLDRLLAEPHGVDLGPLQPRLPGMLKTPSGKVEVAPSELIADMPRILAALNRIDDGFTLIGRRQLRSNNSWMHNVAALVTGPNRCTLQIHPEDAATVGVEDGGQIRVKSKVGDLVAPVEFCEDIVPGVVSLPHGYGHGVRGTRTAVANAHAGVNSNILTDESQIDAVSGNAVLNGIPVELAAA